MSTAQCPKCQGFTTEKMRDAFLESPDIFDDDFHSHLGHTRTLAELLEHYDAMADYLAAINTITHAVKYDDKPADKAIEHINELAEQIRYGGWRYVNR